MSATPDVLGDVQELRLQTIIVPAAHAGVGCATTGFFKLAENPDLAHYIASHATVTITGPISLEISGPVSSTVATTAVVAIYPDKYPDGPTTKAHVVSLEGRINIQHSLLVGSVLGAPASAREVGESLKVKTLVDYPPVIAYHVDIAGGTNTSTWTITAHVPISVGGVSHRKTW